MTGEMTVPYILAGGLASLATVIGILWKKVEAQQTEAMERFKETQKALDECREDRLAMKAYHEAMEGRLSGLERHQGPTK